MRRPGRVDTVVRLTLPTLPDRQALVGHCLGAGQVERITIEPRGVALGVTPITRSSEDPIYEQPELDSRLAMMLGGREAELLVRGSVSSGASVQQEALSGDDFRGLIAEQA